MKQLKILFTFLLFSSWQITEAQYPCVTPDQTDAQKTALSNALDATGVRPDNITIVNGITYIPIRANIVRNSDGSGGLDLNTLNMGLALVNRDYLADNVQFYFCGTSPNYINNSTYYNFNNSQESGLIAASGSSNDAINVFFVYSILYNGQNAGGYAYYPGGSQTNNVFLLNSQTTDGSWQHEFGHYFSVYHTFRNSNNSTITERELVTRGAGANCSTKGDLICDTPADPYDRLGTTAYTYYQNCVYTGTVTDANGQYYSPMVNNIMSYSYFYCNPNIAFTAGQYSRIQNGINLRLSYATQTGGYNIEGCAATVLTAPTALSATMSGTSVTINWTDNASNETGFIIERSTSSTGPFVAVGGVGPNVTTYTDSPVTAGTNYYYRIRASNALNYSNVVSTGGGQPCPSTLTLTAPVSSGTQTFQASQSITSTSQISGSTTNVTYRAGNQIKLQQGFKVNGVAAFKAYLAGCSTARQSAETTNVFDTSNEKVALLSAAPNPVVGGQFIVTYTIPVEGMASVNLANISGDHVKTIVAEKYHEKGTYSVSVNSKDLASGIYLYTLRGNTVIQSKRIVVE